MRIRRVALPVAIASGAWGALDKLTDWVGYAMLPGDLNSLGRSIDPVLDTVPEPVYLGVFAVGVILAIWPKLLHKAVARFQSPTNPPDDAGHERPSPQVVAPQPSLSRDMTVCDALEYLANETALGAGRKIEDSYFDAARMLRQAAYDGEIAVWGYREHQHSRLDDMTDIVLVEVPREHWEDYKIDVLECQNEKGTGGLSVHKGWTRDDLARKGYSHLRVSRSRIEALWPRAIGGEREQKT